MSKLGSLMEQRLNEMQTRQAQLVESWRPYIDSAEKFIDKKEGRKMSDHEKRNLAQVLENTLMESGLRGRQRLFETTDSSNIEFLGVR